MKLWLGLILTALGLAIVLFGIGSSLRDLVAIYANAVNSPLDDPMVGGSDDPAGAREGNGGTGIVGEQAISKHMLRGVWIGAIGIPPLIVGSVLLKWAMFAHWRKRAQARAVAAQRR